MYKQLAKQVNVLCNIDGLSLGKASTINFSNKYLNIQTGSTS